MFEAARPPSPSELAEQYAKMLARYGKSPEPAADDGTLDEQYAKMVERYSVGTKLPTTAVCHSIHTRDEGPAVEISVPPAFWRQIPAAWAEYERGHHASWIAAYSAWNKQ
jgi:hypothetical protein